MSIFSDNFEIHEIPDFDIIERAATKEATRQLIEEGQFEEEVIRDVLDATLSKGSYKKSLLFHGMRKSHPEDLRNAIQDKDTVEGKRQIRLITEDNTEYHDTSHISRSPKCLKGDSATLLPESGNQTSDYVPLLKTETSRDSTVESAEIPCQSVFDKQRSTSNDSCEMDSKIHNMAIERFPKPMKKHGWDKVVAARHISVDGMANLIRQAKSGRTLKAIVKKQKISLHTVNLEHNKIMNLKGKHMEDLRMMVNTALSQRKHLEELLEKAEANLVEESSNREAVENAEKKGAAEVEKLEKSLTDALMKKEQLNHEINENRKRAEEECARLSDNIRNLQMQLSEKEED